MPPSLREWLPKDHLRKRVSARPVIAAKVGARRDRAAPGTRPWAAFAFPGPTRPRSALGPR
jgi:hypothetical protein